MKITASGGGELELNIFLQISFTVKLPKFSGAAYRVTQVPL